MPAFGKMGALFGRMGAVASKILGGPFLLQTNGTSKILLAAGPGRLLITGLQPSGISGTPIGLLVSLTYP